MRDDAFGRIQFVAHNVRRAIGVFFSAYITLNSEVVLQRGHGGIEILLAKGDRMTKEPVLPAVKPPILTDDNPVVLLLMHWALRGRRVWLTLLALPMRNTPSPESRRLVPPPSVRL